MEDWNVDFGLHRRHNWQMRRTGRTHIGNHMREGLIARNMAFDDTDKVQHPRPDDKTSNLDTVTMSQSPF